MLNDKIAAAHAAGGRIANFESSIDRALLRGAELMAWSIEQRQKLRIPASTGHDALLRTSTSMAALMEARGQVIAAHREYAAVAQELGVPMGVGAGSGCPPLEAHGLHLVQDVG